MAQKPFEKVKKLAVHVLASVRHDDHERSFLGQSVRCPDQCLLIKGRLLCVGKGRSLGTRRPSVGGVVIVCAMHTGCPEGHFLAKVYDLEPHSFLFRGNE